MVRIKTDKKSVLIRTICVICTLSIHFSPTKNARLWGICSIEREDSSSIK